MTDGAQRISFSSDCSTSEDDAVSPTRHSNTGNINADLSAGIMPPFKKRKFDNLSEDSDVSHGALHQSAPMSRLSESSMSRLSESSQSRLSDGSDDSDTPHSSAGLGSSMGGGMSGMGGGMSGMGGGMSGMGGGMSGMGAAAESKLKPGDFIAENTGQDKKVYSNFSQRMMAKMGHQEGKGLGRHGQGRTELVESSQQRGRRGLGVTIPGFAPADLTWKFELEEVSAEETVEWLPECTLPALDLDTMSGWMKEGAEKLSIDDETEFVSGETLQLVINCKSVFDHLEGHQMRRARTRSNPYETIAKVFFQNRAAMKMANIDAVLDFMFTSPKTEDGKSLIGSDELLYFADVCAGPGGFSEYVLWRRKQETKGFGFTLRGDCDFKLENWHAASSECFEPHYGVGGLEGDGDVYRPDNQQTVTEFIMNNTNNKGLHFVMADGGFDVEGQENLQEVLSRRLYLCQSLMALALLREGGHFVCKLFDIFTTFSVGLIYLLYRAFKHVAIYKPVTSRPANSERYIVCKSRRADSQPILEYMRIVNECFHEHTRTQSGLDVREVVPVNILQDDDLFFNYIVTSNEALGKRQAISLSKIQTFAKNDRLHENRQADIRRQCLKLWRVPDEMRTMPNKNVQAGDKFHDLFPDKDSSYLAMPKDCLSVGKLSGSVHSVYDYRCVVSGDENRWILLSLGRGAVWKWDGRPSTRWSKVVELRVELPADTLMEVEFVTEFNGEGAAQRRQLVVHVLDAWMLAGHKISNLHYLLRMSAIKKFVLSISRPTRTDLTAIRVKDLFKLEDIEELLGDPERNPDSGCLKLKTMKGSGRQQRVCFQAGWQRYHIPAGVWLIKTVSPPWMMARSSKTGAKYFYNTLTRASTHECPTESIADVASCIKGRLLWRWADGVQVHPCQPLSNIPDTLTADLMRNFVRKHTGK